MAKINSNYDKLSAGYLFPEIARRTKNFLDSNSGVEVMRLGIGDTTEPIVPAVIEGLHRGVQNLASADTYSGYGASEGINPLREGIAALYREQNAEVNADEVFVSDGAKSDSANIQSIFSEENVVAVQDPAYPVYVDSNVIAGRAGIAGDSGYDGLVYMPCSEENDFFPSVPGFKGGSHLYLQSEQSHGSRCHERAIKDFRGLCPSQQGSHPIRFGLRFLHHRPRSPTQHF